MTQRNEHQEQGTTQTANERILKKLLNTTKSLGKITEELNEIAEDLAARTGSQNVQVGNKLLLLKELYDKGGAILQEDGRKLMTKYSYSSWGPLFRGKKASLAETMQDGKFKISLTTYALERLEEAGMVRLENR